MEHLAIDEDMNFSPALTRLAEQLINACRDKKLKLATAESCTGGLIAGCLTAVTGSSVVIERGFVTYSNEAKSEMLNVPESLIIRVGAVSEEVSRSMAEGALANSRAKLTLAVTGIAGPGGSTVEKPVGLVHHACSLMGKTTLHERHIYSGDRNAVRVSTIKTSLRMAIKFLEKHSEKVCLQSISREQ